MNNNSLNNNNIRNSVSTPIIPTNTSSTQQQTRSTPVQRTAQPTSRSISSLASSTLAFLTRSNQTTPKPSPSPPSLQPSPSPINISNQEDDDNSIPIELDSPTPRSSIDTFLLQANSPRSSMESNASFRSSSMTASPHNRRTSNLYNSSPLKNSLMTEHLLCGFAQVVGSFVADSTLINLQEFDPLKHYTMYNPQGGFGGGGGLMVAKSDSSLGKCMRESFVRVNRIEWELMNKACF